jgi:hypothetical protein
LRLLREVTRVEYQRIAAIKSKKHANREGFMGDAGTCSADLDAILEPSWMWRTL